MPIDEQREANRQSWDARARIHAESRFYDLASYIRDPAHLSDTVRFDRTELGDVSGKSLLHLQCHIGTDTISWARLGATVTGTDLSPVSIEQARKLSADSGTPARFEVAELYDTPDVINEKFDIVCTGVGALVWLPDIRGWAQVVSRMLKPGGVFYVRDGHPMAGAVDNGRKDDQLIVTAPYFERSEGTRYEGTGTYADGPELPDKVDYEWNHGLGEIVTSLIDADLRIEFLHEHQFGEWHAFPEMQKDNDGYWRFPENRDHMPLMFSLRATKELS